MLGNAQPKDGNHPVLRDASASAGQPPTNNHEATPFLRSSAANHPQPVLKTLHSKQNPHRPCEERTLPRSPLWVGRATWRMRTFPGRRNTASMSSHTMQSHKLRHINLETHSPFVSASDTTQTSKGWWP